MFSASTDNAARTFDTQLFLFDAAGLGVAANDDNGISTASTLPVGNALYSSLSPGVYYLAVSQFGGDPGNASGLIFPTFPFSDIFGPTGPGGGSAITGWSGTAVTVTGGYQIDLTGVVLIPLPSAVVMGSLGLLGVLGAGLRRRR